MNNNVVALNFDSIPKSTADILKEIAHEKILGGFYLIGGTALSLQTGHRPSEDLDFSTLSEKMDNHVVSDLLNRLKSNGHQVVLAIAQSKISQAKINGYNLLDRARDYLVDGKVKLTFVALRYQPEFASYIKTFINTENDYQFPILSLKGLFATKALLLEKRIKSRDVFDINYMLNHHGYTIEDMVFIINQYGDNGYDYAKSVLTGILPLDSDDEGFYSLGIVVTMEEIYANLKSLILDYEIRESARISNSLKNIKKKDL